MNRIKVIAAAAFIALVLLGALDVIDFHACNGRICIARAGNCHICEAAR